MNRLISAVLLVSISVGAATHRSSKARYQFRKTHPCPSTGLTRGSCKGYVIDHVIALCAGGVDEPSNMQWQTIAEAKAKDRRECKVKAVKSSRRPQ